jgi:hypothetical protein
VILAEDTRHSAKLLRYYNIDTPMNIFLLCFLGATSIFMAGNVGDRRSCQDLPLMGPEGIIADELPQVQ